MSLDDLLRAWAASVTLPDDTATHIRERILSLPVPRPQAAPPPGLPPAWWVEHNRQLADLIIQSTRRAGTGWAA